MRAILVALLLLAPASRAAELPTSGVLKVASESLVERDDSRMLSDLGYRDSAKSGPGLDLVVGAGIGKSVLGHEPFERLGSLGLEYGSAWRVRASGGYWFAPAAGQRSSAFASIQGGPEIVSTGGAVASLRFGPAWVQHPDSKLSGHFQFHLSFGAGIRNAAGLSIRAVWDHWSNAGLRLPNAGRDILGLQISAPLWGGG